MAVCIRTSADCHGRITWEHAWIYAGKQINEAWAIVPLCEHHHFVDLDKGFGQWIALKRATPEELSKYPKRNWKQEYLKLKGEYDN